MSLLKALTYLGVCFIVIFILYKLEIVVPSETKVPWIKAPTTAAKSS
ncbi:hypothetical protein [Candidatus Phytoplasma melaleucae]|uniref:Effector n=1 Tax=Candidatus Phytoplasma melaleucae TaxID=2982630 RepID=A0ABT9DDW8_9MOLU|nr:hypothetical protein ['Melaleuca sp.' phytoplasma]MDO8168209.1 hypothetical protein ['Melaleuca sp.' phytoplasma]